MTAGRPEILMILDNPVTRLLLKAISACGLIDSPRDSTAGRGNGDERTHSPFVLVARAADGRWGVFQQDFDKPRISFDELHEACHHANELAKTRTGSMVLIGKERNSAGSPEAKSTHRFAG